MTDEVISKQAIIEADHSSVVDVELENHLAFTKPIRERLIKALVPGDKAVTDDPETIKLATKLLKDYDDVAINKAKIKISKKDSDTNKIMARNVAEMLKQVTGKDMETNEVFDRPPPTLSHDIVPSDVHKEGELTMGKHIIDVEDFMKRTEFKAGQKPAA